MDPLSILQTIIALTQVTAVVVEYLHDVKDGNKQRVRLSAEISALWLVLEDVQKLLEFKTTSEIAARHLEKLNQPNGPLDQCAKVVAELRSRLERRHGARHVLENLSWTFHKVEVEHSIETLHRLQSAISLCYAQANLEISQASLVITREIEAVTSFTRSLVEDQEFIAMLDWLSPINFEAQQAQAYSNYCSNTCRWFFDSEKYKRWSQQSGSRLWCPGIPGVGKTTMAALVIHELSMQQVQENAPVLGIYIDSRKETQHIDHIVGSLLKQLLRHSKDLQYVRATYRDNLKSRTRVTVANMLTHVNKELTLYKKSYIVIDGLDEMTSPNTRTHLAKLLKPVLSKSSLIITSRNDYALVGPWAALIAHICNLCVSALETSFWNCSDHRDIGSYDICHNCYASGNERCWIESHSPLTLNSNMMRLAIEPRQHDIEGYVDARIDDDENLERLVFLDESLKGDIRDQIVKAAEYTFLNAKLCMDRLTVVDTLSDVRRALDDLTENLNENYELAIQKIHQQTASRIRIARECLKWVMLAARPMYTEELEIAVSITPTSRSIDQGDVVPCRNILSYCCGLLMVDHNDCVRFVHSTAEAYLELKILQWFPHAQVDVTGCCLAYLSFLDLKQVTKPVQSASFKWQYPFHFYARAHWLVHHLLDENEANCELAVHFMSSPQHFQLATADFRPKNAQIRPEFTGLHMAARFGVTTILKMLLDQGKFADQVNAQDHLGRTPMLLAAEHGHATIVACLLGAGASAQLKNKDSWSPLDAAIAANHFDVVKLLLSAMSTWNRPSETAGGAKIAKP